MTTSGGGWGYPPMSTLQGAVPGWPKGAPLTGVDDPVAARQVLAARASTSVVDPVGLRRWWIGDLLRLVIGVLVVGWFADLVGFGPGFREPVFVYVFPVVILTNLWSGHLCSRALPLPGVIPWRPVARVRWHLRARSEPLEVLPPAQWPAGSESLAVLVAAGGATSLAPSWAGERVGLAPDIGRKWVAALVREGWLRGGGHILGRARLPEFHVVLTDEGRERVDEEMKRLRAIDSL